MVNAELNALVDALRLELTGSRQPLYPWLEHGYGEARALAEKWLGRQRSTEDLYTCELVLRLTVSGLDKWSWHVNEVANRYADDQEWAAQGHPLVPALGAALCTAPNLTAPQVVVETFSGFEVPVRSASIETRMVGKKLTLPGLSTAQTVPLSGKVAQLDAALSTIALSTSWWDTSHALEYVLTGHPCVPELFSPPAPAPNKRRPTPLSRQHVALLELNYRLPQASWTTRLETFNAWCARIEELKPYVGASASQAIRTSSVRALHRAKMFSTLVVTSAERETLEHPLPKWAQPT